MQKLAALLVAFLLPACASTTDQSAVVANTIKATVALELKINQWGAPLPTPRSFCAGTVIRPGVVLTNRHCVTLAGKREIFVRIHNGRLVKAHVLHIANDGAQSLPEIDDGDTPRATDAALLSVDPRETLDVIKVASKTPEVGEPVFAIGSPGGFRFTATFGFISFKSRDIEAPKYGPNEWVQHSAALNGGNSGGGLFNSRGELVGVNTIKAGDDIGLAIPIDHILKLFAPFL